MHDVAQRSQRFRVTREIGVVSWRLPHRSLANQNIISSQPQNRRLLHGIFCMLAMAEVMKGRAIGLLTGEKSLTKPTESPHRSEPAMSANRTHATQQNRARVTV